MGDGNLIEFPGRGNGQPNDAQPSDAAARAAALDIRRSFIVEAPAGSGKTGLLLQRHLRLLTDPEVDEPEQVVAATFTRKATHELRERMLEQLQLARQRASGVPCEAPANDFDRTTHTLADAALARSDEGRWQLIERPWRISIRTLDSLAGEIARRLPLLAGGAGALKPEDDARPLYTAAAERTLAVLGSGTDTALEDALRLLLLHQDGNLARLTELLAGMLAHREQWAQIVPFDRADRDEAALDHDTRARLERALENIVCTGLTRVEQTAPPGWLVQLSQLAAELSRDPASTSDHPLAVCALLSDAPAAAATELERWRALFDLLLTKDGGWRKQLGEKTLRFDISKQGKARLAALIAGVQHDDELREALCAARSLPPPRYPDEQWRVVKALFHVLVRAAGELRVIFVEAGVADHAEMTLAARSALLSTSADADLQLGFGGTLRHLLIDEMQDTSASQYDLLLGLTRSWDGYSQTLFLVGDPKQSIYAFRQARVERFIRTRHEARLGSLPLTPLTLTANFRSRPALVQGFNDTFTAVFPSADAEPRAGEQLDPPYTPVSAHRAGTPDAETTWHVTVLNSVPVADGVPAADDTRARKQAAQDAQAHAIAELAREWIRTHAVPAGKRPSVAVLVRQRASAPRLLRALREAGVPCRALDMEPLGTRTEVLDLLALTRALLSPGDRTAWLAVLRAPWCGLALGDLLQLAGDRNSDARHEPLPFQLASRQAGLSAEGRDLLARALPVLQSALADSSRVTLAALVERTWRSLGGDAPLATDELRNTAAYFELLHELEQPGPTLQLTQLERRLGELYAAPSDDPGAIDMCTMHSAKGLEWDLVLVPSLEREGAHDNARLLNWLERDAPSDAEADVVLAPIHSSYDNPDPLSVWLAAERRRRAQAESKRLLYVACTRARERLHLFATVRHKDGELCKPGPLSLLYAAWPFAEPLCAAAVNEAVDAEAALAADVDAAALHAEDFADEPLALAAAGTSVQDEPVRAPVVHRLPLAFDPAARLHAGAANALLAPASAAQPLERPEGSFEARALGNVVHRFLELLAQMAAQRAAHAPSLGHDLQTQVQEFAPRLFAALRGEGLSSTAARRQAAIARRALLATVLDPVGLWLLAPHAAAGNELWLRDTDGDATLRVDRTFLAGSAPLANGATHRWIVDWKTSAQSAAVAATFDADERATYAPQLERYARTFAAYDPAHPVVLALYYPLLPRLVHWTSGG